MLPVSSINMPTYCSSAVRTESIGALWLEIITAYYARIDSKLNVLVALFAFRYVLFSENWYAATMSFY